MRMKRYAPRRSSIYPTSTMAAPCRYSRPFSTRTHLVSGQPAAKALGSVPGAPALLLLRKATGDADAWVRYFAASSMGHQGDGSALDILRRLATTDPAPHVRIAAIEAIGRIGGDSALEILTPLIADETEVGLAAIRASGSISLRARRIGVARSSALERCRLDDPQRSTLLRRAAAQKRLSCFSGPRLRTRTAQSCKPR